MKYLFALVVAICVMPALAQDAPPVIVIPFPQAPQKASPSATPEDFEKYLKRYNEDVFNLDFWKNKVVTNRLTQEEKKLGEFTKVEQQAFVLLHTDRMAREMAMLKDAWDNELKLFDAADYKPVPREKIENMKQNPAAKKDVEKYVKDLAATRAGFAVKQEAFAENFVKENKDLPEKEGQFILKQIRDFNDEHKLIDRQKKEK